MLYRIVAVALVLFCVLALGYWYDDTHVMSPVTDTSDDSGYKDSTYRIDGAEVTLTNGESNIEAAPGSQTRVVTKYFGNEVRGDLNADGLEDVVFLITQETGGSGVFYYVVAALNIGSRYLGSDAVLLGDRIAPQGVTFVERNHILVTYADRAFGEAFTVQPSIGKSMLLQFDATTMQFGEVVQNFEGEANPDQMTLTMKPWSWIEVRYADGHVLLSKRPETFLMTFEVDGKFSLRTDCNTVGGTYSTAGGRVTFGQMMSTLMFCEDSQESIVAEFIAATHTYRFTNKGELILEFGDPVSTSIWK